MSRNRVRLVSILASILSSLIHISAFTLRIDLQHEAELFVKAVPRVCCLEALRPRFEGRLYCLQVYLCFINLLGPFLAENLGLLFDTQ